MKKLLIIGFGKIAEEIVNHFKLSFLIYATTRSKEKFNIIRKNKIKLSKKDEEAPTFNEISKLNFF